MHSFTLRHMNVRVVQSHKASELSSSTMYPKNIVEMPKRINNPIFYLLCVCKVLYLVYICVCKVCQYQIFVFAKNLTMEFWQRVKELLKSQKLTQDKLCKSCDISLATFVSWIHNERLPDLTSAVKIAEALNTSVEFLVSGNPPTFPKDESKEKAAALAQKIINLLK